MSKKVYFNNAQRYLMSIAANTETIIAARRFGKSDGIIAPRLLRNIQNMPRSAGAFYAATFQQALSRTIPAAVHALSRWGYQNEVHYFIGRKAPAKLNFKKPYIEPQSWDHVIHWYNGSITHILSQDVRFSANSLTLDYMLVDEGRSIKKEKFFNEAVPAISGMVNKFDNCPWHKGIVVVSDMPQNKDGEWILHRKNDMDVELIKGIEGTLAYIQELKKRDSKYAAAELKRQKNTLNFLRKHASIYKEYDAIENLEILGESYIAKMKRELTPLVFRTSILNEHIGKLENGFYANLEPKFHYYDAYDNNYLNNIRSSHGSLNLEGFKNLNSLQDGDVNQSEPLSIGFDYNANINCVATGQVENEKLKTLSSMYVKNQHKLRALLEKWHEYYQYHPTKVVVFYFDSTATNSAYSDEDAETFAEIVINTLTKKGWEVIEKYMGNPMRHDLKHQYIDDGLTGKKYLFPMFNRNNNEFLIPAMEQTGVKIGRNGFEKDKSGEKLEETEEDQLQYRTDITDAWDVLYLGCCLFPYTFADSIKLTNFYGK